MKTTEANKNLGKANNSLGNKENLGKAKNLNEANKILGETKFEESSPATPSEGAETDKTNVKVAAALLKTAKGKSYDVEALNKAIADTLSNAGRLKSNANLTKVDLAGDGIFDGKAVALLAKAGTITKEAAAKINAVRKLREAVEALMAK